MKKEQDKVETPLRKSPVLQPEVEKKSVLY
jgi:hypothetical protein